MKKKTLGILLAIVALALAVWFWHWEQAGLAQMDIVERLNHQFTVAAYAITWTIQLGYLAYLVCKWRS